MKKRDIVFILILLGITVVINVIYYAIKLGLFKFLVLG